MNHLFDFFSFRKLCVRQLCSAYVECSTILDMNCCLLWTKISHSPGAKAAVIYFKFWSTVLWENLIIILRRPKRSARRRQRWVVKHDFSSKHSTGWFVVFCSSPCGFRHIYFHSIVCMCVRARLDICIRSLHGRHASVVKTWNLDFNRCCLSIM